MRLLKSQNCSREERLTELKDIGDTVLVQLGLFSKSVKNKMIGRDYYVSIARSAYEELDNLDFSFYDIPNFYTLFATSLNNILKLLESASVEFNMEDQDEYLLDLCVQNKKVI